MHQLLNTEAPPARAFHVMAKPVGPLCNLDCRYCFYLKKESLFPADSAFHMDGALLETHIRQHIESQPTHEVQFAWQGGEPTLAGLDFYRKAVALQKMYAGGRLIHNAFQTNGTKIDDEWCRFFAEEGFLVGLSLDGPENIHNRYRTDKGGRGSFAEVMRALECFLRHGVQLNTLTCITRQSPDEALEIYDFLKTQGVAYLQFIPIVEQMGERSGHAMPWAVSSEGYGRFLCAVFDAWIRSDVGRVIVNVFEVMLGLWCGMPSSLCVFAETCGTAVALEHDGGLYACDHFVYPEHYLGNIKETPLQDLIFSEKQIRFGNDKREALPQYCLECVFRPVCNGGCPKHRFIDEPTGEPGLNYLCPGLKLFFKHIDPSMREMAALVRSGRRPAEIMTRGARTPAAGS